jgi:hypothetical protein
LGLWPRQGLVKVRTKSEARESHFMLLRVWESVREWTSTFPSELLFWEFESRWTLESSENNFRGQKPLACEFPYNFGKILELRCLKWARMTHLSDSNTSYGQKKGRKSNWQFDFRPLKVGNCPDFLLCRWRVTYRWKALDKSYNFTLDLISIIGLHTKLWASKVARVPILGNFETSTWESWDKMTFGCWPHGTEYTIRGKVVASPKFGPWWVLWVCVCPWLVYAPKCYNYAVTNLLFGVCRSMWVIELFVNLLSPILEL